LITKRLLIVTLVFFTWFFVLSFAIFFSNFPSPFISKLQGIDRRGAGLNAFALQVRTFIDESGLGDLQLYDTQKAAVISLKKHLELMVSEASALVERDLLEIDTAISLAYMEMFLSEYLSEALLFPAAIDVLVSIQNNQLKKKGIRYRLGKEPDAIYVSASILKEVDLDEQKAVREFLSIVRTLKDATVEKDSWKFEREALSLVACYHSIRSELNVKRNPSVPKELHKRAFAFIQSFYSKEPLLFAATLTSIVYVILFGRTILSRLIPLTFGLFLFISLAPRSPHSFFPDYINEILNFIRKQHLWIISLYALTIGVCTPNQLFRTHFSFVDARDSQKRASNSQIAESHQKEPVQPVSKGFDESSSTISEEKKRSTSLVIKKLKDWLLVPRIRKAILIASIMCVILSVTTLYFYPSIIGQASINTLIHPNQNKASSYRIVAQRLNVRNGPGTKYDVIYVLDQGATVDVLDVKQRWGKIALPHDFHFGWISLKYAEKQAED